MTESLLVAAGAAAGTLTSQGHEETFTILTVVVTQLCKLAGIHRTVHLGGVNFVAYKKYLDFQTALWLFF